MKTLYVEKRGCDFWNDDEEMQKCSDLKNYRVHFEFIGKDGLLYCGSAYRTYIRRWHNLRTGKPLKNGIVMHQHGLALDLQYDKTMDDGRCLTLGLRIDDLLVGKEYTKADLLDVINFLSAEHYDNIEVVDDLRKAVNL